jgi:hypothetical protein
MNQLPAIGYYPAEQINIPQGPFMGMGGIGNMGGIQPTGGFGIGGIDPNMGGGFGGGFH